MQSPNATVSTRSEKVHAARDLLDQHLQELAEQMAQGKSENLLRYLEFSAQFHSYSFGNILLIWSQKPNATRVAGLRQWNKLGRHVRSGEKGIMILAPMTVNKRVKEKEAKAESEEDSAETEKITLFKPVYVFDVSATEGDALPSLLHAEGDVTACRPALEKAIRDAGLALEYVDSIPGRPSAAGVSMHGRILVRSDLEPPEAFRTLIHEWLHEENHWDPEARAERNRTVEETEADAAAFVVCRHFGVRCDTADYLLLYDSEPRILLERLETIRRAAARIIEAIEGTPASDSQPS
jgi:antirestriction protein ArdC